MEVAGLTASIITLIGAATLAGSTVSRIWGLRDSAPTYVLTALNEIDDFKATLQLVRFALEGLPEAPPDFIDNEIARFLKRADRSLADFNNYLHEKVLRNAEGDGDAIKLRRRAKLKEILGEAEPGMRALQQELTSIKLSLNTALAAMHLRNSGRSSAIILQEVSSTEKGTITTASQEQTLVAHTSYPISRSTVSASDLAISSGVLRSVPAPKPRTCQRGCPCQCHQVCQRQLPRWLSELSGFAYFRSLGVPVLNHRSCDFKLCSNRARGTGKFNFQYTFPRWILPYTIDATAWWQNTGVFDGNWSLKIPRFCADMELSIEIGYYLREKSALDFAKLMATHGLRAFDQLGVMSECLTLLEMAMSYQREDVFIMLLESGADISCPDAYGSPLVETLWLFHSQAWPTLRCHSSYVDASDYMGRSLRHHYLMDGTLDELVAYLKEDPQAVVARDSFGYHFTLLHWAVIGNAPLIKIQALIDAGADVNVRCTHGLSALMWSVQVYSSVEMAELLLANGADINEVEPDGDSVLFRALSRIPWHGNEAIVEYLLRSGANVHYIRPCGKPLLLNAVTTASVNTCRVLLDHGAHIDTRDYVGWFPITMAIFYNHHQALELLIERGARLDAVFDDEDYFGAVLLKTAMFGSIRTMQILTRAQIAGVRMDPLALRVYWACFSARDEQERFLGKREAIEVERKAFQELLDSVIPLDLQKISLGKKPCLPGTFFNKGMEGPYRCQLPEWNYKITTEERPQTEKLLEPTAQSLSVHAVEDSGLDADSGELSLEQVTHEVWHNPLNPRQVS